MPTIELSDTLATRFLRICDEEYRSPEDQLRYLLDMHYTKSSTASKKKRTQKLGTSTKAPARKSEIVDENTARFQVLLACAMVRRGGNKITTREVKNTLYRQLSYSLGIDKVSSNLANLVSSEHLQGVGKGSPAIYNLTDAGYSRVKHRL